jgi:hypothetical protein
MSLERQLDQPRLSERNAVVATPARYLVAVLGGAIAGLLAVGLFYGGLHTAGKLPPPPLSNNSCIDEKLIFLRNNPPTDPNFLVIGSSVAWRSIDSSVIAREMQGVRPFNAGFCGLQVNQSAFIAGWLTERWPSVRQMVLIVSPLDYESCKGSGQVFDPTDTSKLVFDRKPMWSFYLRYFDPVSLIRNIEQQAIDRERAREMGVTRVFTEYGDGPLDTTQNRGLFYGPITKLDKSCFGALRSLATKLTAEGRHLMVVTMPVHPEWISRYDSRGSVQRWITNGVTAALAGTGADLWNAMESDPLDASAFTDAVHIRWSAAGIFTEQIVRRLQR